METIVADLSGYTGPARNFQEIRKTDADEKPFKPIFTIKIQEDKPMALDAETVSKLQVEYRKGRSFAKICDEMGLNTAEAFKYIEGIRRESRTIEEVVQEVQPNQEQLDAAIEASTVAGPEVACADDAEEVVTLTDPSNYIPDETITPLETAQRIKHQAQMDIDKLTKYVAWINNTVETFPEEVIAHILSHAPVPMLYLEAK